MLMFVLLFLISLINQSCAQPIITRVSGCTDVGEITMNCSRSSYIFLTIYGSGFDEHQYGVQLGNTSMGYGYTNALSINDTVITARYFVYYGQFMHGDLLNVSLRFGDNLYATAPRLSFTAPQPVIASRVTNCPTTSSNGLKASGCNFVEPITIVGSGFNMIIVENYDVRFGSKLYTSKIIMQIVNDTMIVINIADKLMIPLQLYNQAADLTISGINQWQSWQISVSLQFSSIPPVQLTSFGFVSPQDDGCIQEQVNNRTLLSQCKPGRSIVRLFGKYMWDDTQIFIAGILTPSSDIRRVDPQTYNVLVPILDGQESVYHDIRIVNAVTDITIKNVVNIVSTPEIAMTIPCVKKQRESGRPIPREAFCLEGEIFKMEAVNIRNLGVPRIWFGPYECPNVVVTGDYSLQCQVPKDPDGELSVSEMFYLSWPQINSSAVQFNLWDDPLAPRVTFLVGTDCYQSADVNKPLQCLYPSQGHNLTAFTSRLTSVRPLSFQVYYNWNGETGRSRFADVYVDEAKGAVSFWLPPNMYPGLVSDETEFQVALSVLNKRPEQGSNFVPLLLVSSIVYDNDSSSSSSSKSLTVSLAVILPLLFVFVLAVIWWWRRSRQGVKSDSLTAGNFDSEGARRIEMA